MSWIDHPARCEIRADISYLHPKNTSALEVHCELCVVDSQNVMSEGTLRQRCRMFKDRRTNVHTEEQSVQPSVMSDDLVH
jgi:hypothetical protein